MIIKQLFCIYLFVKNNYIRKEKMYRIKRWFFDVYIVMDYIYFIMCFIFNFYLLQIFKKRINLIINLYNDLFF